jgi:hypothetical protein
MTAPLTPESQGFAVDYGPAEESEYDEMVERLRLIEAAAIARYSEGRADECCSGCEEPSGHRGIPEGAGGLVHQERGEP